MSSTIHDFETVQEGVPIHLVKKRHMETSRKHKRRTYATDVIFTVGGIQYRGISRDISVGGVFIETNGPFIVGQEIVSTLQLCNTKRLSQFHGRIARIAADGIAVEFSG